MQIKYAQGHFGVEQKLLSGIYAVRNIHGALRDQRRRSEAKARLGRESREREEEEEISTVRILLKSRCRRGMVGGCGDGVMGVATGGIGPLT